MKKAPIKYYYPVELANMYGISYKQFARNLQPYREKLPMGKKRMLSAAEVEYIFSIFGRPDVP